MRLSELKEIVPSEAMLFSSQLLETIKSDGLLSPISIASRVVVDGQRRIQALRELNLADVPVFEVIGNPFFLRWKANLHRLWNPVEMAFLFRGLPDRYKAEFCHSMDCQPSHHLFQAFDFILMHPEFWEPIKNGSVPLFIIKELAVLGPEMPRFLELLVSIKSSVAEKRILTRLLHHCQGMGVLPDITPDADFGSLKDKLEFLAQPRRKALLQKFQDKVRTLPLPPKTTIDPDPTFESRGVTVKCHLKRHEVSKLVALAECLEKLFSALEEI